MFKKIVSISLAAMGLVLVSACGQQNVVTPETDLTGIWEGFVEAPYGRARVGIEISAEGAAYSAEFLHMIAENQRVAAEEVQLEDGTLSISAGNFVGAMTFDGMLQEETGHLVGRYSAPFGTGEVTLIRNNPDFRGVNLPRVDQQGNAVTRYTYSSPEALDDGWPVSNLTEEGIDETRITALMEDILAGSYGRVDALLIARGGKLALEEYFHGYDRDMAHSIQSVTKSVNAVLVGKAIDDGFIGSVEDKVHRYFEDRADAKWVSNQYPITLRHLLLMSSAIDWNEKLPYSDPNNSNTAMNASGDWIGYVLNRDQAGDPGEVSVYSSGQSMLLGGAIKNATGRYADEYAADSLFKAMGITRSWWFAAPDGTRHTGGGLMMKPRDLLKFAEIMRSGIWDRKQVISREWVEASAQDALPIPAGAPGDDVGEYGYQWWLPTYEVGGQFIKVISGLGYGGQYLGYAPALDATFVLNASEWGSSDKLDRSQFVGERLLPALIGAK